MIDRFTLGCVFDEDCVWFYHIPTMSIVKMKLYDGSILEYRHLIEDEKSPQLDPYSGVAFYKNYLIFAPFNADNIMVYDLKLDGIKKIKIVDSGSEIVKYSHVYVCGNIACFIPSYSRTMIFLNLENWEIEYNIDIVGSGICKEELAFVEPLYYDSKEIVLLSATQAKIVKYSLLIRRWEEEEIEELKDSIVVGAAVWQSSCFVVLKGKDYILELDTNKWIVKKKIPVVTSFDINSFYYILDCGKYFLIPISYMPQAIIFYKDTFEFEDVKFDNYSLLLERKPEIYYRIADNNWMVSFRNDSNGYAIWNSDEKKLTYHKINKDKEFLNTLLCNQMLIKEDDAGANLFGLIDTLKKGNVKIG